LPSFSPSLESEKVKNYDIEVWNGTREGIIEVITFSGNESHFCHPSQNESFSNEKHIILLVSWNNAQEANCSFQNVSSSLHFADVVLLSVEEYEVDCILFHSAEYAHYEPIFSLVFIEDWPKLNQSSNATITPCFFPSLPAFLSFSFTFFIKNSNKM